MEPEILDKLIEHISKLKFIFPIILKNKTIKKLIAARLTNYFYNKILLDFCRLHSKNYVIRNDLELITIFNNSPFKGFISNYFFNDAYKPTSLNIAVALNIASATYANQQNNINNLIDLSKLLADEINSSLQNDIKLSILTKISNKDLKLDIINKNIISNVYQSNQQLFDEYFKCYSDNNLNSYIDIWYPQQGTSIVDWNQNNANRIFLNLSEIRMGFFIFGCGYKKNNGTFLSVARRKGDFEYFNEDIENSEIVWLN